jgi:hypothetical protein
LTARFWPVARRSLPAAAPDVLDAGQPSIYAIALAVPRSYFGVGGLALVLGFASWYVRRAWQQTALLLVAAALMVPQWGSTADFLQSAGLTFVSLAVIWWGARKVVRFNLFGYFLAVALLLLAGPALDLLRQPNSFFRANGWALAASGVVLLLWPLMAWRTAGEPARAR